MNNGEERGREEDWKRDGENLFRLMIESVSDYSIFAIDPGGRILSWNKGAEEAFGYREEEIVGESFAILFTPEDRSQGAPERELENVKSNGQTGENRWHLRKDGSRLWVSGLVNSLKDETGNLIGYVKVARGAMEEVAGR
jgi:PAS domain S-box-containing protein